MNLAGAREGKDFPVWHQERKEQSSATGHEHKILLNAE